LGVTRSKIEQESRESSEESGTRQHPLSCGLLSTFSSLDCPSAGTGRIEKPGPAPAFSDLLPFGTSINLAFTFEKLLVYQRAIDFADQVCATTEHFPRGYGFLCDQLNRAALSIAANIAEGNGRFTKADRRNFFGIARGSAQECVPMLELARRRSMLTDGEHASLKDRLEEIARMLSGLIRGLENRDV
jgi:four helix bundle protein